jgi:hypothetical protein
VRVLVSCHAALLNFVEVPRAYFRPDRPDPASVARVLTTATLAFARNTAADAATMLPCPPAMMSRREREAMAFEVEGLLAAVHGPGEVYYDHLRLTPFTTSNILSCPSAMPSLPQADTLNCQALSRRADASEAIRLNWLVSNAGSPLDVALRRAVEIDWERKWNRPSAYAHHQTPERVMAAVEPAGFRP